MSSVAFVCTVITQHALKLDHFVFMLTYRIPNENHYNVLQNTLYSVSQFLSSPFEYLKLLRVVCLLRY